MKTYLLDDLLEYQEVFDYSLTELYEQEEDDIEYVSQTHFGDLLVESTEIDGERYKLYRNLDENVTQGEPLIEIQYCGERNNYIWESIIKFYE